jgi:hypothetical protein
MKQEWKNHVKISIIVIKVFLYQVCTNYYIFVLMHMYIYLYTIFFSHISWFLIFYTLIPILIYVSEESPSPVPNNDAKFTFEGDEYPMEFDKCADRYVYHLHEYMYMYIYTHIYIYINIYICLYLCIHIYKYITIYRFKNIPWISFWRRCSWSSLGIR